MISVLCVTELRDNKQIYKASPGFAIGNIRPSVSSDTFFSPVQMMFL